MKIIIYAMIILITSGIGIYFSAGLNARRLTLKAASYMLDDIAVMIRYKSATVYEILDRLAENERLKNLKFLKTAHSSVLTDMPFSRVWEEAIDLNPPPALQKNDIIFLKSIGKNLGNSDVEGQLSIINLEKGELKVLYDTAENDLTTKAKLYRTLGLLAGAFIVILII